MKNIDKIKGTKMRESDKQQKSEIEIMIAGEEDKQQRALLLVLHNINQGLIANTELTREYGQILEMHIKDYKVHKEEFATHSKKEEEIMNKGKGAYKILMIAAGAIQTILIVVFAGFSSDMKDMSTSILTDRIEHQEFKIKIESLDKRVK